MVKMSWPGRYAISWVTFGRAVVTRCSNSGCLCEVSGKGMVSSACVQWAAKEDPLRREHFSVFLSGVLC